MFKDLRHAGRQLVRAPAFTAVAVAALAIGIGANTAIFSVIHTLLIERLPYPAADRLAMVWEHNLVRDRRQNVVGPANYLHWREMQGSFEELAALGGLAGSVTLMEEEPEVVRSQNVTAGFFPVLGVSPVLGRGFTPEEAAAGRVILMSERLWRRRFAADPGILERAVNVNGTPYSVVGVMPAGFSFLDSTVDVWGPLALPESARTSRGRSLAVVGRLKPGVSVEAAQADMARAHAELARRFPAFNTGWTVEVVTLRDQLTASVRPALLVLLGAVGLVLLIACANVANLLLTRATGRQREFAVRAALGAGRGRLVRQFLAESLLLAAAGGAAGLLLAWWGIHLLRGAVAQHLSVQRLDAVAVEWPVLAFALLVSLASGLLFGLVPAFTATAANLADALKQGGRTGSAGRGARARSAFVVAEVALALVLLVGAGLLVRSFTRLLSVDAGFDPERTVTMRLGLAGPAYAKPDVRVAFFDRLFDRIEGQPGVEAAGAVSFLPLTGLAAATSYEVVGAPAPPVGQEPVTDVRVATPGYFEAMRIPLLEGRLFTDDEHDASGRIVVSETFARRHWPGESPLGRRVTIGWNDSREDEIIGVVGDVRHAGLDAAVRGMIYWPYARFPYPGMTIAIRTGMAPEAVAAPVAAAVRDIDPRLAVTDVKTLERVVDDSVAERRAIMQMLGLFALAALLLASVGIYGVIAYTVTQRTREIGIRLALGADAPAVLRMVVRGALVLAATGVGIGALGALALTRLMTGFLYGIPPTDPLTFAAVAGLLLLVAVLASGVPALRATRVDPAITLRSE